MSTCCRGTVASKSAWCGLKCCGKQLSEAWNMKQLSPITCLLPLFVTTYLGVPAVNRFPYLSLMVGVVCGWNGIGSPLSVVPVVSHLTIPSSVACHILSWFFCYRVTIFPFISKHGTVGTGVFWKSGFGTCGYPDLVLDKNYVVRAYWDQSVTVSAN